MNFLICVFLGVLAFAVILVCILKSTNPKTNYKCNHCLDQGIRGTETKNQQIAGCEMDVTDTVYYSQDDPCPHCGSYR